MTPLKENLINLYLDYVNNYLTVKKFASDHDITEKQMSELIIICKKIHESTCPKDFFEFEPGNWISTKKHITEEQKNWHIEDNLKNFNFLTYNYWITTDNGAEPEGYDSIAEIEAIYGPIDFNN